MGDKDFRVYMMGIFIIGDINLLVWYKVVVVFCGKVE